MKILFLGTAAATSMPLLFCNCPVCTAARANGGRDYRKRSAALINDDMLIDLSPDLAAMAAMYGIDTARIRWLLQTHSHADHFDAGHFVTRCSSYAVREPAPLDVVCSEQTFDDMNRWVQLNEPDIDLHDPRWQRDMAFTPRLMRAGDTMQLGEYTVTALDSRHDPRLCAFIYLIEQHGKRLLYATDLLELDENVWQHLRGHRLDAAVLDCTYGEGFNSGGHIDAGQLRDIVARMRSAGIADERTLIYATHISHEGNDTHDRMEQQSGRYGYHIAYDGLVIEL